LARENRRQAFHFCTSGLGMGTAQDDLEALLAQSNGVASPRRGDLFRGQVLSVSPRGLIIDLGMKRDGFAPSDDLNQLPAGEPRPKVGDEVAVMVVDPVDADGNLLVSVSQARESGDWLEAQRHLEQGTVFEAVPSGYNRGGLVVPFGRLRGFVPASHLSDLPRGSDEASRGAYLQRLVGRRMPLRVIEVDPQRQRLVLSERKAVRQWRQEQKARVMDALREGEVRRGMVTSLREFGAFVDIGGADGLIHISEISWKHVEDPAQVLRIGDEVDALVLRLDRQANRIGLSLKRLLPNPWTTVGDTLQPGAVHEGTVTRLSNDGVHAELACGLEGRVSLLGSELPSPGSRLQVRVVEFDAERERLQLALVEGAPAPAESEPA
jgi:small subunit ribosomal protein S1